MDTVYLSEFAINNFIHLALQEDVGEGDYTTLACIPKDQLSKAKLLVKEDCILAGVNLAERIFLKVDPSIQFVLHTRDAKEARIGDVVFEVFGSTQSILKAERLVLNCMQRMSGIATYTRSMVEKISHTKAKILDTRKTTPNFRIMEKWAVLIGGGVNHRFDLSSMILLKDNHVDACGGIVPALQQAFSYRKDQDLNIPIVIETRNLAEVKQSVDCGLADRIMFDNMTPSQITEALKITSEKVKTEASGGISDNNIVEYAETGVDYVSCGSLTHSAPNIDLSLKIFEVKR